jgi:hypothetical protein
LQPLASIWFILGSATFVLIKQQRESKEYSAERELMAYLNYGEEIEFKEFLRIIEELGYKTREIDEKLFLFYENDRPVYSNQGRPLGFNSEMSKQDFINLLTIIKELRGIN